MRIRQLSQTIPTITEELYQLAMTAYPGGSPWNLAQFVADFANPNTIYLGAYNDQQLLGFISCQQVFDEVEITNVAVARKYHGQGIGQKLLASLVTLVATSESDIRIFLEVRESNLVAQRLYHRNAFEMIHRRKAYYHNPTEDAYIMMRQLPKQKKE